MASEKFAYLLRMVLALGNFLNYGGGQGNAHGFKLDALTKLKDVKTATNNANLLHVLANILEARNPSALDFYQDFPAVEDARRVPSQLLKGKIKQLRDGYLQLLEELNAAHGPNENEYRNKLAEFAELAERQIKEVDYASSAAEGGFRALLHHFGEDGAVLSEDLFEMLAKFATMLAAAHAENAAQKRRAAYQEKRAKKESQQAAEKAAELAAAHVLEPPAVMLPPPPTPISATETSLSSSASLLPSKEKERKGSIESMLEEMQTDGPKALGKARRPPLNRAATLSRPASGNKKSSKLNIQFMTHAKLDGYLKLPPKGI